MKNKKRYSISPFHIIVYTLTIVYLLVPFGLLIILSWNSINNPGLCIGILVFLLCTIVGMLYLLVFDYPCGSFSFDNNGFRMRIGLKNYYHKWSDIQETGIIKTRIGNTRYFYICYFAVPILTIEDKKQFYHRTRKKWPNIGFFQYNHQRVIEIANYLPDQLKKKLVSDERVLGLE